MNEGTILQRTKKCVRFTKEEIMLILRAYRAHPTRWSDVLEDVRQNIDQLPDQARNLYRNGSERQLRDRMSVKLGKLVAGYGNIQDQDIRQEVDLVRAQERRLVVRAQQPPADQGVAQNNANAAPDQQPAGPGDAQNDVNGARVQQPPADQGVAQNNANVVPDQQPAGQGGVQNNDNGAQPQANRVVDDPRPVPRLRQPDQQSDVILLPLICPIMMTNHHHGEDG